MLFDVALQDYENLTNIALINHPFAEQLQRCRSIESITSFLQDKAREISDYSGSDRMTNAIRNIVSILSMVSGTAIFDDPAYLVCLNVPMQMFYP